jgi:hypothetical protein
MVLKIGVFRISQARTIRSGADLKKSSTRASVRKARSSIFIIIRKKLLIVAGAN